MSLPTPVEVIPGNYYRFKAEFIKASTGVLTSPTSASATLIMPDGTTTTESLAELSTGVMYIDILIPTDEAPGLGVFRPYGSGAVAARAKDIHFRVFRLLTPTEDE